MKQSVEKLGEVKRHRSDDSMSFDLCENIVTLQKGEFIEAEPGYKEHDYEGSYVGVFISYTLSARASLKSKPGDLLSRGSYSGFLNATDMRMVEKEGPLKACGELNRKELKRAWDELKYWKKYRELHPRYDYADMACIFIQTVVEVYFAWFRANRMKIPVGYRTEQEWKLRLNDLAQYALDEYRENEFRSMREAAEYYASLYRFKGKRINVNSLLSQMKEMSSRGKEGGKIR